MKKLIIVLLLLAPGIIAVGQEKKMSLGAGLEWNMDSRHNFAGGTSLHFSFNVFRNYSLGVNLSASYNFNDFTALEPTFFVRRYFKQDVFRQFFLQLDMGSFIIFENEEVIPMFDAGLKGGYRFLLGSSFYIEPYGRMGYPFAFGIGAAAGFRF